MYYHFPSWAEALAFVANNPGARIVSSEHNTSQPIRVDVLITNSTPRAQNGQN